MTFKTILLRIRTETIVRVKNDRFLSNSLIFFIASFFISSGNYVFHFLMARLLSIDDYGTLQSVLSLSVIFGVPISALSLVFVKYTAHFSAQASIGKIKALLLGFTKAIGIFALLFSAVFLAFSFSLSKFLNLTSFLPLLILGLTFAPGFLITINRGIMQGLENFKALSLINVCEILIKIGLAALFVVLGFRVQGVIGALLLSSVIAYFLTFKPLKFLFQKQQISIDKKKMFAYFFPVLLLCLFISLFYNIDIILVKHFFDARTAGEYGALALIGHIIFFLSCPVVAVMFPMTSANYANNTHTLPILKKTVFLAGLIGLLAVSFYFLIPGLIIKILVGSKFLQVSKYLGWFGLAMGFFALVNLFSQYFISLHKTKFLYFLALGSLLQIVLISLFHQSLGQVVLIMNVVMFFTFLLLLGYYFFTHKKYVVANLRTV